MMPFFAKMENSVAESCHKWPKHVKQNQEEALRN